MPPDFSSLNLVDLHYNKPVQDVMILKDCHNVVDLKTFKNNTHNNNDNEKVILGCTDIENQESKKKKKKFTQTQLYYLVSKSSSVVSYICFPCSFNAY